MNLADKLTVEQWPIDRLIEYVRNPRKNDAKVDQMAAAIREFGFRIPIVAKSDGSVVDGHLRLKAARKLGLTEVPVALADELTDAQIKAFRLIANRSATWAEWDTELLRLELGELNVLGFDLTLTGFGEIELGSLLADKTEGLTDPDDAPAVPEHPVSQTGDLWLLGRHRLLCGDSTVATDVERVLGGIEPHLMVTDPPYGIEYDPAWRNRAAAAGLIGQKKSTRATGQVENDDRADWSEAWALFPGAVAYIWHAGTKVGIVQDSLDRCDFENSGADRLGQKPFRDRPRPLPLQARAVLVRSPQWLNRALGRRPQADHGVEHRQEPEVGDWPRHAKAGRVHAAADREQLLARPGRL